MFLYSIIKPFFFFSNFYYSNSKCYVTKLFLQSNIQITCEYWAAERTTSLIYDKFGNLSNSIYFTSHLCDRLLETSKKIHNFFFADQGSSKIESGQTPRQNMTLSFYTWSEFEKNCGYSRLYGGVNFPDSVANIRELGIYWVYAKDTF